MQIQSGLLPGAVLQRDAENQCCAAVKGVFAGTPAVSVGTLTKQTEDTYLLTGIPVGGPYAVTVSDGTDTCTVEDIYVGDVWLLAGQSNMEGAGRMNKEDHAYAEAPTDTAVRALYMTDTWGAGRHPLHESHLSPDPAIKNMFDQWMRELGDRRATIKDIPPNPPCRAVGPGLAFGQELYRLTGVPQGLIPCAVGGAPIEMWQPVPEGEDNYLTAALRRITLAGGRLKGIFWSQGEGNPNYEIYGDQLTAMRDTVCKLTGDACLPLVLCQSFTCSLDPSLESGMVWSRFREMQRHLPERFPQMAMIAPNDLDRDDAIHLSREAQMIMGVRGAHAMYRLCTGEGLPEPDVEQIWMEPDSIISDNVADLHIRYKNVAGALHTPLRTVSGFSWRKRGEETAPGNFRLMRGFVRGSEVILRIEMNTTALREYELWYGWGHETVCCITDEEDRAIPAFGPLSLADVADKEG